MAGQTSQSSFFGDQREALAKAAKEHRGRAPEISSQLPAGVKGIARVLKLEIKRFESGPNKGKPFFTASAAVVHPKEHKGIPIEGLHTYFPIEPLCATPTATGKRKTFSEHWGYFRDNLMVLGLDIDQFADLPPDKQEQAILALLANATKPGKPPIYTRFRTWESAGEVVQQDKDGKWRVYRADDSGKPTGQPTKGPFATREVAEKKAFTKRDRPNHSWEGGCDWHPEEGNGQAEDPGHATQDATGGAATTELTEAEGDRYERLEKEHLGDSERGTGIYAEEQAPAGQADDGTDPQGLPTETELDALVAKATAKDRAARLKLTELAVAAGRTKQEVEEVANTWQEVADWIKAGPQEQVADATPEDSEPTEEVVAEEQAEEPAEPQPPAVGETWRFQRLGADGQPLKLKDPKGKLYPSKPIPVEVRAVYPKNETCDVVDVRDGKTVHKGVEWVKLLPPE